MGTRERVNPCEISRSIRVGDVVTCPRFLDRVFREIWMIDRVVLLFGVAEPAGRGGAKQLAAKFGGGQIPPFRIT